MANSIEYAYIFQKNLDQLAVQEAKTGWMEANAGQVIYNGGNTVKLPKMSLNGLADYSRESGFVSGAINFSYETLTMSQDRGRKFTLDAMDVDETNFALTAGAVMGEFQRTQVVPEIDAYRLSKLGAAAVAGSKAEYNYTPAAATILSKIKAARASIRKQGYTGRIYVHITSDALTELEIAIGGQLRAATFSQGGLDTTVPILDGDTYLIETADDRMHTAITLYDGTTGGQTDGGFVAAGKQMNFIAIAANAPIAVSKQDKMRIFDPNTYQDANAWAMDYRRYHELWIPDNKKVLLYANIKDAQGGGSSSESGSGS